ncbi:uncharacterized protein ARB_00377 [Trichophyton benhamiae CBS 112371]|uniref:Rhomboid family protein n=1 Tax=Arthroderma benhamiae (strain ATCC MYA-4681 / CBS 112371) TaxID=663331 RepID=D4AW13_ARTBC|nr:uncharacterized protein ARB_00377 [Trichophyton benhamiae CBS 112371]EFE32553.1 conserved hypothetical protein [Trichophyton benhamiae CBS 112371]
MLSSGFTNAPVTKLALVYIIAASILVSIADAKYLFYIQLTSHRTAMGIEESFILSTLPFTTLLPPLILTIVVRPLSLNTLNHLPAGPTAILFAILAQYHATIPTTYKYRLLTGSSGNGPAITFSDKSTIYFLAFQLALSQLPHTILPAFIGWVVGYAWRAELLPSKISSWRIPGWIYGGSPERQRRRGIPRNRGDGDASSSGTGSRDPERLEGLRRRLEGESRAAFVAVASTDTDGGRRSTGSAGGGAGGAQEVEQRRPLAGQILDRFRGTF